MPKANKSPKPTEAKSQKPTEAESQKPTEATSQEPTEAKSQKPGKRKKKIAPVGLCSKAMVPFSVNWNDHFVQILCLSS